MQVTRRGDIFGHIINHDTRIEPLILTLSPSEREAIAAMAPDATRIVFYEDPTTSEEALAMMDVLKQNKAVPE